MRGKKAESMSINVIIIAVIALLVLVVLMAIFGGQMADWVKGLKKTQEMKCTDRGEDLEPGRVVPSTQDCDDGYMVVYGKYTDVQNGFKCCVPTGQ